MPPMDRNDLLHRLKECEDVVVVVFVAQHDPELVLRRARTRTLARASTNPLTMVTLPSLTLRSVPPLASVLPTTSSQRGSRPRRIGR